MPDSLPRPTTELFPEALNLSPKQREVLTAVQRHPEGAKAGTVAEELGMHVNTARGHIDELVNAGAVNVVPRRVRAAGAPPSSSKPAFRIIKRWQRNTSPWWKC